MCISMSKMFENRFYNFAIYGFSFVVISEIAYFAYKLLRKRAENQKTTDIEEIIWTNELTQSCRFSEHHEEMIDDDEEEKSPLVDGGATSGWLKSLLPHLQSPTTTKTKGCPNRYCSHNNIGRLVSWIDQTKHTIDLAMYTFTSHDLSLAFHRAIKRGVNIRIISDKEMIFSTSSKITSFNIAGVPVRSPCSAMLLHHKFCVLDGPKRVLTVVGDKAHINKSDAAKQRSILISGSLNWTQQGFNGNWENIMITSSEKFVNEYESEFERMWIEFGRSKARR